MTASRRIKISRKIYVFTHENSIFRFHNKRVKTKIFYALEDLASNSSTMRDFPLLSIECLPKKNIRMKEFRSPAVRNNLWDDKARILNNQSHFLFLFILFNPHTHVYTQTHEN